MADQYLVAGGADLRTDLLKAGQNDEIALIHHLAAVLLNVARAGFLLLLGTAMLGERRARSGDGQQGKYH